jgi:hypothetical protein
MIKYHNNKHFGGKKWCFIHCFGHPHQVANILVPKVELSVVLNAINTIVEVHAFIGLDLLAQVIMLEVFPKTSTLDSICATMFIAMFITKTSKHANIASMVLGWHGIGLVINPLLVTPSISSLF